MFIAPHLSPKFVPKKLVLMKISYQTIINSFNTYFPGWGVFPDVMNINPTEVGPATWWLELIKGCMDGASYFIPSSNITSNSILDHERMELQLVSDTMERMEFYCTCTQDFMAITIRHRTFHFEVTSLHV
jgi:hypothetical protein